MAQQTYNLVLCDVVMPGKSGWAMLESLSTSEESPPCVLMSGHLEPRTVAEAFRRGAADVLVKPFGDSEVERIMSRVFSGRTSVPERSARTPNGPGLRVIGRSDGGRRPVRSQLTRITNWTRVLDLVRRAIRGSHARLIIDDVEDEVVVSLGTFPDRSSPSGQSATVLRATAADGDFSALRWKRDLGCAVWFSDVEGVHGFRSAILGGKGNTLVIAQPSCVVRYTRRAVDRVPLIGNSPGIALSLTDGTSWESDDSVVDISTAGLALRLPLELVPTEGDLVAMRLTLRDQGRPFTITGCVRRCIPTESGVECGMEFINVPFAARIALERFVENARRLLPAGHAPADLLPPRAHAELRRLPIFDDDDARDPP